MKSAIYSQKAKENSKQRLCPVKVEPLNIVEEKLLPCCLIMAKNMIRVFWSKLKSRLVGTHTLWKLLTFLKRKLAFFVVYLLKH